MGLRWTLIAAAALFAWPAAAAAAAPDVVVQYLETITGTSFAPAEKARIVAVERRLALRDAAGRQRTWTAAAAFLRQYRGAKLEEQAYLRHRARAAFQLAPQPDPTALRIVLVHDPVILTDAARKEAVTVADLRAVQVSNDFVSRMTGVAPPPGGLTPVNLTGARRAYRSGAVGRMVLTEAQVRDALRRRFWAVMSPAQRTQLVAKVKGAVRTPDDVATVARELEGAFTNAYLRQMRKDAAARKAAMRRAGGSGMGDALGRYVAIRRAMVGYDAMAMSWSALHF